MSLLFGIACAGLAGGLMYLFARALGLENPWAKKEEDSEL